MTKALYILAEMDDRDIDWLATAGRQRTIPANHSLIRRDQRPDALYLVLSGKFSVQVETEQGAYEIAHLGAGDIIGEMSFIDARMPYADVTALEESLVWSIPWTKLSSKLMLDPSFAAHFYHAISTLLSDRMRKLISQIDVFKIQDLEEYQESDLSPEIMNRLELVKVRFDFLIRRLKETRYQ